MKIMKFGGKSLSSPQKMQNICKNIKKIYKNNKKIIIIVSAIGSTTDELINKSKQYYTKKISKRELDVLLTTGETQSSALLSIMLNDLGVPAKSFQAWQLNISTFGDFQSSKISYINKQPLLECLNNNCVAVISGFQGVNSENELTTLGRGGSDTTASAIGAIFDNPVEIYSDYDGVFCGDPRILNFKKIKQLNYSAMKNMSLAGAKVLETRSTEIAENFNINITCKQSDAFHKSGTIISNIEKSFISLSTINSLCKISINFSNINKFLLSKTVINELNNVNFYNLSINNNVIEFFIEEENKLNLIKKLSKKLNLITIK